MKKKKRKHQQQQEQEIITLRSSADDELKNLKDRLEEALEQKLRMENLYREQEQKYKQLQLEFDRIQAETNQRIDVLEKRKLELEQSITNDNKELEALKEKIAHERKKNNG